MKNTNTLIKSARIKRIQKICKGTVTSLLTLAFMLALSVAAFADSSNPAPSGVDTTTMSSLVAIVLWIVRVAIGVIAVPGILKIVQGQADENPRDRNAGITTVAIAGACFAATFAVPAILGL